MTWVMEILRTYQCGLASLKKEKGLVVKSTIAGLLISLI